VKHKMAKMKWKWEDQAERELKEALLQMPQRVGPTEICLTLDLLKRFAARSVRDEATRTRILAHFDVCPRCLDTALRLHKQRIRFRRVAMALAAIVLIAAVLWIWAIKPSPHSESVALVDLSVASPTRSNRHIEVPSIRVGAGTRQVRIVLPKVSSDDMYEIGVFRGEAEGKPILHNSASPTMLDHNLEMKVDIDFSRIPRGSYLLGIRHDDSNWEYVPLVRE
jgi:hypothetical protein